MLSHTLESQRRVRLCVRLREQTSVFSFAALVKRSGDSPLAPCWFMREKQTNRRNRKQCRGLSGDGGGHRCWTWIRLNSHSVSPWNSRTVSQWMRRKLPHGLHQFKRGGWKMSGIPVWVNFPFEEQHDSGMFSTSRVSSCSHTSSEFRV